MKACAWRAPKKPLRHILELLAKNQDPARAPTSDTRPPVAKGAVYLTRLFQGEQGARGYSVYLPEELCNKAALIVMLHGCGQTSHDFAIGTRMNVLAEEHGFVVAYPCQALTANRMGCWNWYNRGHQSREMGEPSIIAGITRRVMQEFDIDPEQIFIAGLSSGGAMAAVLGATYPELYAAVGIHSGLPYGCASDLGSALSAMRGSICHPIEGGFGGSLLSDPLRTIVFHGTNDAQVHPSNSDKLIAQARTLNSSSTARFVGEHRGRTYVRTSIFDGSCAPWAEHWLVEGLGHAWSGGSAEASHTDPNGPDASSEMIRFFLEGGVDPVFAPVRADFECFASRLA
jgi:poly(hydroxyalkanoate) depolymerase family esterase